jgi:hypothetical protein
VGKIDLEGEAPFDLGTAQRTSAESENGFVELTVRIVLDGHGPHPQPIRIRMTNQVAGEAASQLVTAAKKGNEPG